MKTEKTVEVKPAKLTRRTYYKDDYKFFEDVFIVTDNIKKQNSVPVEMLREIKNRIYASKKHKVKSYIFKKIKPAASLTEILVLCVCLSDYLKKGRHEYGNVSKAQIVNIAHQSGLDNLQKIIAVTHEKKSFLFANHLIMDVRGELSLTPNILDLVFNKKRRNAPPKASVSTYSPAKLYEQLGKYVISQDKAKRDFCTAVFEHLLRCHVRETNNVKINKNNIFMTGPTGTGKTYICQSLAKILNIPVCIFDATQYSETGYVGMDIGSIIPAAYRTAGGKAGKFNPCIIFIDEIDKIAASNEGGRRDVGGRGVQQELLKMLESDHYIVEVQPGRDKLTFNLSNVLFVVAGAFAEMNKYETRSVGFAASVDEPKENPLIKNIKNYGFIPELLGRFSSFVELSPLSKEDLRQILLTSEESVLSGYRRLFSGCNAELKLPEEKVEEILDAAHKNGTGARGLMNALGGLVKEQLFNMELKSDILSSAQWEILCS